MTLHLLGQFRTVLACGCICRCLSLWDSTLWFLNQWILEISDSCIRISLDMYLLCKNLRKLTFFSLFTLVDLLIHILPVSLGAMGHKDHWLMSYFFCEHHLKDTARRRTLHRQNTLYVLRSHFKWENLKHQVSLNEWLLHYQIHTSQLGSQEQMQLFPGQWGMRLKADVQM